MTELVKVSRALGRAMSKLEFGEPVTHVYNPLHYAKRPHEIYLDRFGASPKEVVFVGMNPGPFGMAQTGVPFGDVGFVRDWMGIEAPVDRPPDEHPKRPVLGFALRAVRGQWFARLGVGTGPLRHARAILFALLRDSTIARSCSWRRRAAIERPTSYRAPSVQLCCLLVTRHCAHAVEVARPRHRRRRGCLGNQACPCRPRQKGVARSAPSSTRAPPAPKPIAAGRHKRRATCAPSASSYRRVRPTHALCFVAWGSKQMLNKVVPITAVIALGLLPLLLPGCGHESAATQQVRSAAAVDLELRCVDDRVRRRRGHGQACERLWPDADVHVEVQCHLGWRPGLPLEAGSRRRQRSRLAAVGLLRENPRPQLGDPRVARVELARSVERSLRLGEGTALQRIASLRQFVLGRLLPFVGRKRIGPCVGVSTRVSGSASVGGSATVRASVGVRACAGRVAVLDDGP